MSTIELAIAKIREDFRDNVYIDPELVLDLQVHFEQYYSNKAFDPLLYMVLINIMYQIRKENVL